MTVSTDKEWIQEESDEVITLGQAESVLRKYNVNYRHWTIGEIFNVSQELVDKNGLKLVNMVLNMDFID